MALEFLGISPAGLNGIPAINRRKGDAAEECGRLVMQLVRDDVRPSQIITRDAIENAAASVAATGGSTNGVLHLLAIARELGHAVHDRRVRRDRRRARRSSPASSRAASSSPPTCSTPAAWRWWRAS